MQACTTARGRFILAVLLGLGAGGVAWCGHAVLSDPPVARQAVEALSPTGSLSRTGSAGRPGSIRFRVRVVASRAGRGDRGSHRSASEPRPTLSLKARRVWSELDRVTIFERELRPDDFTLEGLVRHLSCKLNSPLSLSRRASAALQRRVQLPAAEASALEVLDHVTAITGLSWDVRSGRVEIETLDESRPRT